MLNEDLKHTIQTAYSTLLEAREHKPRYGQKLMIAEIARCLGNVKVNKEGERSSDAPFCVVEAGTGTGKTVAYTLAALPIARSWDKTLVISTATVALQEQIVYRDLPDILRHSGLQFSFALAKGRGRYLCLNKLDRLLSDADPQQAMALYPDEEGAVFSRDAIELYQHMLSSLSDNSWAGDRDDWPEAISDADWQPLTVQRSECTGRRCANVGSCSFFKAREEIHKQDCIVANHDLVLADLALGGGVILPDPAECIYIFDEGHHLPERALRHFSAFSQIQGARRWFEHVIKLMPKLSAKLAGLSLFQHYAQQVPELAMRLENALAQVENLLTPLAEEALDEAGEHNRDIHYRFEGGILPEALSQQAKGLVKDHQALQDLMQKLYDTLDDELGEVKSLEPKQELEVAFSLIGQLQTRVEAQLDLWQHFAEPLREQGPPDARWLSVKDDGNGLDFGLHASPILAADYLRQSLWSRCFAAVLTSATLTALGKFDRFCQRSGISHEAVFTQVPSPFNYQQAKLLVPRLQCEPNNVEGHTQDVIEKLQELVDLKQGTLTLFSSRRQMKAVYEGLPPHWQGHILMQGDSSKQLLLQVHKKAVDSGQGSVIFGLASFAEGVDLPGDYCRHVIIARIPFAVPDDPCDAALAEWIESRGGNAFMEIAVPDAATRLTQAMGRLLRKESDTGQITLLDKRIVSKRYGRMLLQSLPPFTQDIQSQY